LILFFQSNERPKSTGDGPTQRASALAALSNAFKPSSKPKTPTPPPSRSGQGSQRAAAVAALSSVLTAEQSGSSENLRAKATSTADKTGRAAPSFTIPLVKGSIVRHLSYLICIPRSFEMFSL
jgi:hypothetical protein